MGEKGPKGKGVGEDVCVYMIDDYFLWAYNTYD